jgi:hypothetical protein
MNRWMQGLCIIIVSVAVTVFALAAALAWGPHHCKLAFPMVIGCAMGSYEALTGGLFAAGAGVFAGWIAWSAVQLQINAEEKRAVVDRIEVERVLSGDLDSFAEALAAIWKILEALEQSGSKDKKQIDAVIWGMEKLSNQSWLSTSRKMVAALGWDRRRNFEELFVALERLGQFRDADSFDVFDALSAVRDASVYFEILQPQTSDYFEGLFRRSPKAWSLGYAIQVQAGVEDQ